MMLIVLLVTCATACLVGLAHANPLGDQILAALGAVISTVATALVVDERITLWRTQRKDRK